MSSQGRDIFSNLLFAVDFAASSLPFNRKQELRKNIVENGGTISYLLTKKSDFLVTGNAQRTLSSYKGQAAVKYGVPVISLEFIDSCIKDAQLLDPGPFLLSETLESKQFSSGKISSACRKGKRGMSLQAMQSVKNMDWSQIRLWPYNSADAPGFPEEHYDIAKDMILKSEDPSGNISDFCALELHVVPTEVKWDGLRFRVFSHHGSLFSLKSSAKECHYCSREEEAVAVFTLLHDRYIAAPHQMIRAWLPLSHKVGSAKMIKRNMDVQCTSQEGTVLSQEVRDLVEYAWNEAAGRLCDVLSAPVNSVKLDEVVKAEGTLLSLKEALELGDKGASQVKALSDEFYSAVPHRNTGTLIDSKSLIAQKQDLCQLIKDVVSIGEATNWSTRESVWAKYRSLKCHVQHLSREEEEFEEVENLVISSQTRSTGINILNVYTLNRPVEESNFTKHINNERLLFHASKVSNYVGILSRGLMLPKIVVDDFGGKRSDPGMLGSGIYFADSASVGKSAVLRSDPISHLSTSAKFSTPGRKGTRLMVVNEVALGNTKEYRTFAKDLTCPPHGYQSTRGVKATEDEPSDFKENEFAVYKSNQQRLRYLVEFCLPEDEVCDDVSTSIDSGFLDEDTRSLDEVSEVDLSDVVSVVDPLTKVTAGLKGTGDKPVPLRAVHIRAKLLDLAAQVVVLQAYTNNTAVPIEAKYVFPLDDMAAVCGFEAFINGKHIVGEVKEKEQAHKEYREAISKGHGAYLMDEETPDVFTVNVGNLPPRATVLIKITYVAELVVDGEHICFALPGTVAPWTREKALDDVTQSDIDTVRVGEEEGEERDLSVQIAVEMPFAIRTIHSPTHAINIKRTSTKAVVELERGSGLADGFQLHIGLAEIHVPRMWVERHDGKSDSQACMLTFYPEFEADPTDQEEIIFILDLSCSMKGAPLQEAKKLLLLCLSHLRDACLFNVLVFGDRHAELFPHSKKNGDQSRREAADFVKTLSASKGSTELWRALSALYLLDGTGSHSNPRNLFVISDGHVTEEANTLALIRGHCQGNRVFTLGVGSTANRHLLRAMARVGAGSAEFFDNKVKSKWESKVKSQLAKATQPGLTSVTVAWQQHDDYAKPPVQAPHQLVSLFSGSRQVVYGFVDNCTQATLSAEVHGKVISTMVSTSELSITSGKILHQLTARAIIRDWDEGSLDSDRTRHEAVKRERKDYIISLSKQHKIVTKFTSFVAVETREKGENFDEQIGPTVEELVADEEVDIIPYVDWETKPEPEKAVAEPTPDERVKALLQEGRILETCAILQAERCYGEAGMYVCETHGEGTDLYFKALTALCRFYLEVKGDTEKGETLLTLCLEDPLSSTLSEDAETVRDLRDKYRPPSISGTFMDSLASPELRGSDSSSGSSASPVYEPTSAGEDDGIEKQEDYGRSFCLFGDDSDSSGELEEEEGEMIGDGIEEQEDCVRLFGLFGDGSASSGELEMEEMEVDEAEDEWRAQTPPIYGSIPRGDIPEDFVSGGDLLCAVEDDEESDESPEVALPAGPPVTGPESRGPFLPMSETQPRISGGSFGDPVPMKAKTAAGPARAPQRRAAESRVLFGSYAPPPPNPGGFTFGDTPKPQEARKGFSFGYMASHPKVHVGSPAFDATPESFEADKGISFSSTIASSLFRPSLGAAPEQGTGAGFGFGSAQQPQLTGLFSATTHPTPAPGVGFGSVGAQPQPGPPAPPTGAAAGFQSGYGPGVQQTQSNPAYGYASPDSIGLFAPLRSKLLSGSINQSINQSGVPPVHLAADEATDSAELEKPSVDSCVSPGTPVAQSLDSEVAPYTTDSLSSLLERANSPEPSPGVLSRKKNIKKKKVAPEETYDVLPSVEVRRATAEPEKEKERGAVHIPDIPPRALPREESATFPPRRMVARRRRGGPPPPMLSLSSTETSFSLAPPPPPPAPRMAAKSYSAPQKTRDSLQTKQREEDRCRVTMAMASPPPREAARVLGVGAALESVRPARLCHMFDETVRPRRNRLSKEIKSVVLLPQKAEQVEAPSADDRTYRPRRGKREEKEKISRKIEILLELQSQEGYWELSAGMTHLMCLSVSKCRETIDAAGAKSLGRTVYEQVLRLIATLLVLFYLKKDPAYDISLVVPGYRATSSTNSAHALSRALAWIRAVERRVPFVYSRLGLGANWEAAIEKMRIHCECELYVQ